MENSTSTNNGNGAAPYKKGSCLECKRSHVSCSFERPCKRCILRGLQDSCVDPPKTRRGRKPYRRDNINCEQNNNTPSSNFNFMNRNAENTNIPSSNPPSLTTLSMQFHINNISPPVSNQIQQPQPQTQPQTQLQTQQNQNFGDVLDLPYNIDSIWNSENIRDLFSIGGGMNIPYQNQINNFTENQSLNNDISESNQINTPSTFDGKDEEMGILSPNNFNLTPEEKIEWKRIKSNPHFKHFFDVDKLHPESFINTCPDIAKTIDSLPREGGSDGSTSNSGDGEGDNMIPMFSPSNHPVNAFIKPEATSTMATKFDPSKSDRWVGLLNYVRDYFDPLLKKMVETTTVQDSLKTFLAIEQLLKIYETAFNEVDVPLVVFERSGIIHYVNKSFRKVTGFDLTTPTPQQLGFYRFLNEDSIFTMAKMMLATVDDQSKESIMMPAEIYCYDRLVDCYLTFTVKLDHIGLPMLLVVSIQPKIDKATVMSQLPNVVKQLSFDKRMNKLK